MRFVARLLEQQQRPGHVEFDIVRVRAYGYGSFGRHHAREANLTGRPVSRERSAAKITSWLLAAIARLVSGISRPFSKASKKASNCVWYGWSATSPESSIFMAKVFQEFLLPPKSLD